MNGDRIYFMDPLRGILMALGVVLHSAQVFNPEFTWLIHSPQTSSFAVYLVLLIHLFRMPSFYIVSGFFAFLTVKKYGPERFLKLRAEKILIPFIVTAITLNSFQAWLLQSPLNPDAKPLNLSRYFWEGHWVSHLWFLGYLFAYLVAVSFGERWLFSKSWGGRFKKWSRRATSAPVEVLLLVLPLYYLGLVILGKLVPQIFQFHLGFSIYDLLYYFQFFAFGLTLAASPALFQGFTRFSFTKSAVLIGVWVVSTRYLLVPQETLAKIIEAYTRLLIVWVSCQMVFSLFKALADRPSKWATFTSSASYTVYLFHHSLVILLGLLLIQWNVGGVLGFLALAIVVSALGAAIHVGLISKSSWAGFLFNGVRSPGVRPRIRDGVKPSYAE